MKRVTVSLIGLLVAAPLLAQTPEQREREHVVRTGDTLWELAGYYLSNPFQWRIIYQANTSVVEDPHWIYPEEVLRIPLTGRVAAEPIGTPLGDRAAAPLAPAAAPAAAPLRTAFYKERPLEQMRDDPTLPGEPAVSVFPVREGEFHSAPFLADPGALPVMGRFIRSLRNTRHVDDDVIGSAHPQDQVFLSRSGASELAVGDQFILVRAGRIVPEVGRSVRVIYPTGVVRVSDVSADVVEGRLVAQYDKVYPGDLVVAMGRFPDRPTERSAPVEGGWDLEGRLIEFVDEQPLYGRAELAFIDLGAGDGVVVGDVFTAYLPGREADVRAMGGAAAVEEDLPPEPIADLLVVRVDGATATVKVDRLAMPQLEDGLRVRRTASMP